MKTLSQGSQYPGRGFNLGPAEYEARLLTTRPRRSVLIFSKFLGLFLAHRKPAHYKCKGSIQSAFHKKVPTVGGGGVGSVAVRGESVLVGGLKGCYWWKTV
jgi:hypothetical protein